MKLHHLGIACVNIEESLVYLKNNFEVIQVGKIIFDELQGVSLLMVYLKESIPFELISGETVKPFIKRNAFIYHLCYEVVNLPQSIITFVQNGATVVSPPKPAVLFAERPVAFLSTKLGLIELLQE
jgi:hypothetical protein